MSEERLNPLWELTKARWREFYREPGAVFWVFGFPILMAVVLGVAFRSRPPEKPRVAVASEAPAWLRDALAATTELEVLVLARDRAEAALRVSEVDLLIEGNAEREVTYRFDPMRAESRTARLATDTAVQRALGRKDVVTASDQAVTEQGGRYVDFLLPGLLGLNLMGSSMWGIGYAVVLARKRRLLRRFAASPMRRSQFLGAYILSRLAYLVLEVIALLTFGWAVFDVQIHGSVLAVGALALLGSAAFAGLALLIAARAESIEAASGWMNAIMMPMWLASGSFFSYARFPESVHPYLRALPLTALNDALRHVMNEGASITDNLAQVGVLLAWGIGGFVIALRTFKWQ